MFAYCSAKSCVHCTQDSGSWLKTDSCELMCTFICSQSLLDHLKWVNVLLKLSEILQDKNVRHIWVLVCCSDVNLDIFGFRTEPVSRLNSRMQIYLPVSYSSTSLRQVLKRLVLFLYLLVMARHVWNTEPQCVYSDSRKFRKDFDLFHWHARSPSSNHKCLFEIFCTFDIWHLLASISTYFQMFWWLWKQWWWLLWFWGW